MKKYLAEVEKRLKSIKPSSKPSQWKAESYIGGGRSHLAFLDLKIPDVRGEFKKGFSFYNPKSDFNARELAIFDFIWRNSNCFEALLFCLFYIKTLPFAVRRKNRKLILGWLGKVDNWALSDELSSLFSEFLEDDPRLMKTYKNWNRSKNSWKRRQSIVGIIFYARFRKSRFLKWPQIRSLIQPLLDDEDYYVQKGVGWCLREAYQWYPEEVYNFIHKNVATIKPAAWYACAEKMPISEKNKLKSMRRRC